MYCCVGAVGKNCHKRRISGRGEPRFAASLFEFVAKDPSRASACGYLKIKSVTVIGFPWL